MKFKLPPPVLFIISALIIYFLPNDIFPYYDFFLPISIISFIFSALLAVFSLIAFYQKKNSLDPIHLEKTTILVTHSIYRISRNPMYLSLAMLLIAWALWVGNLLGLVVVGGFIYAITCFQIIPEEQFLEKKFGVAYLQYKKKVARWL
ncbi:methyltransferase family protein [Otariodibacter oris]|uniref:Protein-S-isoprenylcysteine O-methyltransferase Ste14 n=1 Tax=Otariodibacter oris TaxID=1032623 RepID=A0A420XF03_9PAST|nr:isoprenylcysteine carboxylmethyltransferase family protein [Otariodibacter oris]QGM80175.1 hypothetical protein A6A10_01545 [Otariodibacter oris]RKR70637.1 protein-S-isoprenylcysteine O-methyltransferase Ste14 [Otariodibacter oris]